MEKKEKAVDNQSDPTEIGTFTNNTCLNYFHLHKTGGMAIKGRLFEYFSSLNRKTQNGRPVVVFDTCHKKSRGEKNDRLGTESEWSCNLKELESVSDEERSRIYVAIGHQYWETGEKYFNDRDMRYFAVLRHPLHRKISFYYHFLIRNLGVENEPTL